MNLNKLHDSETQCTVISVNGELVIDTIQDLKKELLTELAQNKVLIVNLQQVKEIDLSAIQLFFSAWTSALIKGVEFKLQGQENSPVMKKITSSAIFTSIKINLEVPHEKQ